MTQTKTVLEYEEYFKHLYDLMKANNLTLAERFFCF